MNSDLAAAGGLADVTGDPGWPAHRVIRAVPGAARPLGSATFISALDSATVMTSI